MQVSILKIYVHLDPQVSFQFLSLYFSPTRCLALLCVCVCLCACMQHICAVHLWWDVVSGSVSVWPFSIFKRVIYWSYDVHPSKLLLLRCCLSHSISCRSPPAGQEVENAGTPPRRQFSQAKGIRVRPPPERLSVMGAPRLTSPDQPCHDGVLHLQWALHRLHPGGQLAATATHAGRFSVSAFNNKSKNHPVKRT